MEKETRYFKLQGELQATLFVKPPNGKAQAIYVRSKTKVFGLCGHVWTIKEIKEKQATEITRLEANELISN